MFPCLSQNQLAALLELEMKIHEFEVVQSRITTDKLTWNLLDDANIIKGQGASFIRIYLMLTNLPIPYGLTLI